MIANKDTFINTHKCTHYTHTLRLLTLYTYYTRFLKWNQAHTTKNSKVPCCLSSSELVICKYGIINGLLQIIWFTKHNPHLPPAKYEDTKTKEGRALRAKTQLTKLTRKSTNSREVEKVNIYIFGIWNLELNHVLGLKSRGELSLLLCYILQMLSPSD
jgi:hypothetical protein